MTDIQIALLAQARLLHGVVLPCAGQTLEQGFREQRGRLEFYFIDRLGNTHMLSAAAAASLR